MMRSLTYHVGIGSDGSPEVSVSSEDAEAAARAIPWVRATYAHLATQGSAPAPTTPRESIAPNTEPAATEQPPICQVHSAAMIGVNGRRGFFWSCHTRNQDGSWCTYRPART